MTKKQSASSLPEKLIRVSAADIGKRGLSAEDRAALARIAAEQLAEDVQATPSKELVAMRIDSDILKWVRGYGEGYSARINSILRAVMDTRQS